MNRFAYDFSIFELEPYHYHRGAGHLGAANGRRGHLGAEGQLGAEKRTIGRELKF